MEEPGQKLRRARERLHLRYRDVEEASQRIAIERGNEFLVGLSRLADIENKGTLPSLHRLYSLCAIYRLEFHVVLKWYGIDLTELPSDAAGILLEQTHPVNLQPATKTQVEIPVDLDYGVDSQHTFYLSRAIRRWGKLPVALLNSLDLRHHRYAFIGAEDWSMHPLLPPGSFVQIDESKRKIPKNTWTSEYDRPIYFVEHRNGYRCGWCAQIDGNLVVEPHPSSHVAPEVFRYPGEVEVIGQVIGVAKRLDLVNKRRIGF